MKQLLAIFAISIAMLTTQGCSFKYISHGSEITDEQIATIQDGKTTKSEVFINFGNPSKSMDNEKVFFYTWTRGSKNSVLGIGAGSAYTYSLVVVFDDKGIVKSHKLTRGSTESGVRVDD